MVSKIHGRWVGKGGLELERGSSYHVPNDWVALSIQPIAAERVGVSVGRDVV